MQKRIDRAGKADEVYLVGARVPTRERCSEEEGDGARQEEVAARASNEAGIKLIVAA